jgi:hypothetical protein
MPAKPDRAPWTPPLPLERLTPPLPTLPPAAPPADTAPIVAQRRESGPPAPPVANGPRVAPPQARADSAAPRSASAATTVAQDGRVWTMAELLQTTFPPPRQIVPDLLPVGLAILSGRPKFGKSFLALQLAIAVGSGGRFLGRPCQLGNVLYLALEDGPRRIQNRSIDLGAPWSADVFLAFAWAPLNAAGFGALRAHIQEHKTRLVIVDTLTRAFTGRTDWDHVGQATENMGRLQHLALDCECCILFVDHHRKGNGLQADIVDDTMGSTGKTAVADVVWGIYRERSKPGAMLKVTGRDIEDLAITLAFDPHLRCWQTEQENLVQPETLAGRIVQVLRQRGQATTTELARLLERDRGQINRELAVLVLKDVITRGERVGKDIPYQLNS